MLMNMNDRNSGVTFWVVALVWLPVLFVVAMLFRIFIFDPLGGDLSLERLLQDWSALLPLLVLVPAGLPLALACRKLSQAGSASLAYSLWVVLGLLTVPVVLYAGLLGPIAIVIYAVVVSLPVWLVAYLKQEPSQGHMGEEGEDMDQSEGM